MIADYCKGVVIVFFRIQKSNVSEIEKFTSFPTFPKATSSWIDTSSFFSSPEKIKWRSELGNLKINRIVHRCTQYMIGFGREKSIIWCLANLQCNYLWYCTKDKNLILKCMKFQLKMFKLRIAKIIRWRINSCTSSLNKITNSPKDSSYRNRPFHSPFLRSWK